MITKLLLTNGKFVQVGKKFPFATVIDAEGKEIEDQEEVRIIIERPESQDDSGDVEPAHYECWVVPEAFQQVLGESLMLEQIMRARALEKAEFGVERTAAPSENILQTIAANQAALEQVCPKVTCHKVQAAQVVDAMERVPIAEAWKAVADAIAVELGIQLDDAEELSEDGEEAEQPQQAAANGA